MKVVSNTSPLAYLILIRETRILPELFREFIIPPAVRDELGHPDAPESIQEWIVDPPRWLSIAHRPTAPPDQETQRLDPGETEVLLLADTLNPDLLVLDDWKARRVAKGRGLPLTGLIGVLDLAIERDLIDARSVVDRLRATTFRVSDQLLQKLLRS
jgi:predicted nucleic acid-binding protein